MTTDKLHMLFEIHLVSDQPCKPAWQVLYDRILSKKWGAAKSVIEKFVARGRFTVDGGKVLMDAIDELSRSV